MDRWRLFGLATLLVVLFLACLFLVTEAGGVRMHAASEEMQRALARQIMLGELRERIAESGLAYQSFLITGNPQALEPLRTAGARINDAADAMVASYLPEPPAIAATARKLRYLAGVQIGAMMTTIRVYASQGPDAALNIARAEEASTNPTSQVLRVAEQLERYEAIRRRETRANWVSETQAVRRLAAIATMANIVLVVTAMLMARAVHLRHRELTDSVARQRDALEIEATARAAELNEVYGRLQTVQELERSRLARGLHDELGGLLLAARMDVTWLAHHETADQDSRQMRLRRVLDVLAQGIDIKRRVIEELRPTLLDTMGLVAALRWQLQETCGRGGVRCTGHFPEVEPAVDPRTAIALFRVAQEALANVVKHAQARHVNVTLEVLDSQMLLVVADDGLGLTQTDIAHPLAHGMAGMKHRIAAVGGTLNTGVSPAGGAEIRALVPRTMRSTDAA